MGNFFSGLSTRYKAWIAFFGSLATAALTLLADPQVRAILPHGWQTWLAAGGGALITGVLTWLKTQKITPAQVDNAVAQGHLAPAQVQEIATKYAGPDSADQPAVKTTADMKVPPPGAIDPEKDVPRRKPPAEGVPVKPPKPL